MRRSLNPSMDPEQAVKYGAAVRAAIHRSAPPALGSSPFPSYASLDFPR